MSILQSKRRLAFILACLLAFFLIISPLLDVYGEHDHSCSANRCMLCLATAAISVVWKAVTVAVFCTFFAFLTICPGTSCDESSGRASTPVTLRNKITS